MNSSAPASFAAARDRVHRRFGFGERDVLGTLSVNKNVSSNTIPTARRSSRRRSLAHVDAVEDDAAGVHVVEAGQEPGDRRLAAGGRADHRDGLAGVHDEVEAVEHRRARPVPERHALERTSPPPSGSARGWRGRRRRDR